MVLGVDLLDQHDRFLPGSCREPRRKHLAEDQLFTAAGLWLHRVDFERHIGPALSEFGVAVVENRIIDAAPDALLPTVQSKRRLRTQVSELSSECSHFL